MIRIMEKGEVFKKTYTPTSLYLRFPKGEISQQNWVGPIKSKRSLFLYGENRIYSKEMFRPAGEASDFLTYFPTD